MQSCIFFHWNKDNPENTLHEGECIMGDYRPRDAKEAQYGIDQMAVGFSKGYHQGLREGYSTSRYPERCHCCHCRSHGEMCKSINHCTL